MTAAERTALPGGPVPGVKLQLRGVEKVFSTGGRLVRALAPTSIDFADGEFVSLVGPSGCGKSTLLYIVAGLEDASAGAVLLDGRVVSGPAADRGMVFQNYTLFPWLDVLDNVRFAQGLAGSALHRLSEVEARSRVNRVRALIELMGLADFTHAYPRELSGGMKQRVAIARALANDPEVLLMDEPFGALDAQTREEMQELLLLVRRHWGKTIVFVTHDVDEAIYLSDRIVMMSPRPGRVRAEIQVDIGCDGSIEQKLEPGFLRLKKEIVGMLHEGRQVPERRADLLERMFRKAT